ncbi:MAG: helix-turn-helix transcriptional regulator [Flavimaricola sp.]|nr:helix-turn-helix transcriptional regulator [Flavimaricola sp.]
MTHNRSQTLRRNMFLAAAILQVSCGIVFTTDVFIELAEFTRHTWVELVGVIALAIGAVVTLSQYLQLLRRNSKIESELDAASGAFQMVIEGHFRSWNLTEAERDVALLSIKGVSISDIAVLRQTRVGTIKSQCAAIYRKSGVSSRAELVSVVIEDLLTGLDRTSVLEVPMPD